MMSETYVQDNNKGKMFARLSPPRFIAQVYKWVRASSTLGVTLYEVAFHPEGGVEILLVAPCF